MIEKEEKNPKIIIDISKLKSEDKRELEKLSTANLILLDYDFLSLNDDVKELIQFAAEHGIIEYKTENQEGLIEDKSTAESNPLIVRVQYDPDVTDQHYLIQSKALEIVTSIN